MFNKALLRHAAVHIYRPKWSAIMKFIQTDIGRLQFIWPERVRTADPSYKSGQRQCQ